MRVSFLIVLACLCLSAVSAAKEKKREQKEQSSFVNADGFNVQAEKSTVVTEDTEVKEIKNGDVVEEEEVTKIRTSVNGKRKGKRKVEKAEKVEKTCEELLAPQRAECDAENCATKKCSFSILSESRCEFECKCEEIIEEVITEVVESEGGSAGAEKKVRKVKKAGAEKKKKKKVAGGRECAGEKKLSFSNCLIKMKGLVAWGDNTANFDAKFDAL